MKVKVESGILVKVISCVLAFTNQDVVNFTKGEGDTLVVFNDQVYFSLPATYIQAPVEVNFIYHLNKSFLKPLSTLKAKVIEEDFIIDFDTGEFISGLIFYVSFTRDVGSPPEIPLPADLKYLPTDSTKTVSKYLGKFGKDNFKGAYLLCGDAIAIPGVYQTSYVPCEVEKDDAAYLLKSTNLNKLLKLGQDLSFLKGGRIVSSEEIKYSIKLPKAPKESAVSLSRDSFESIFTEELPKLIISSPKLFKEFLKNTKSDDKQYDLCSLITEGSRIVLSFYTDKQTSNKFVFNDVDCPDTFVEIHLQTKHLLSLAEVATNKIEIVFSSNFQPIKVIVDEIYISYIMQGIVV